MRQSWTDDRLDELSRRMDSGFDRIDTDMREMRTEIGAMHRAMIQVGGGLVVAVLGLIVTQL